MRLELGTGVYCNDQSVGELVDVVIDPISRRVTHLVVEPDGEHHRTNAHRAGGERRATDGFRL